MDALEIMRQAHRLPVAQFAMAGLRVESNSAFLQMSKAVRRSKPPITVIERMNIFPVRSVTNEMLNRFMSRIQ